MLTRLSPASPNNTTNFPTKIENKTKRRWLIAWIPLSPWFPGNFIQWDFLEISGQRPGFMGKSGVGMVSGDLRPQKVFARIAKRRQNALQVLAWDLQCGVSPFQRCTDHSSGSEYPDLSGPLRLRLQSRSRTRLRIAASIAFWFRACFKGGLRHYSATIARLSPPKRFRTGRLRTPTCAGMRDRAR